MSQNNDQITCPRCGKALEDRNAPCPFCHYSGYIPMSEAQIKRTKRNLAKAQAWLGCTLEIPEKAGQSGK